MAKMNLKQELNSNKAILVLVEGSDYNSLMIDNLKSLSGKTICYVTLNKTYSALEETFKKNHIKTDNIYFIDAISKTIKKTPDQVGNCYFVSSPSAMTEISLVISKFLKMDFDYLIFDSLTNLLIYQKKAPVAMFMSSLVNKIRESNTKAAFFALGVKEQEELIKECEMFVDKVIDLTK
jgi:hypothetical protein